MQNLYNNFIGIDIGKSEFVSFLKNHDKTNSYKNNHRGFQKFLSDHKPHLAYSLVVLETTGGYESACLNFLLDNLDAKALSLYGYERQERLNIYKKTDKNHDELKLLIERRQDLKQMLIQEKNRFKAPLNESLQSSIKAVIYCLNQQISTIDEAINKIIESNKELSRKREILRPFPALDP